MDRVTDSLSVKVLAAIGRNHAHRRGTRRVTRIRVASGHQGVLQGSQYFRRTQWDSAATAFKEAVALDSTFGIAYLHLAQASGWSRGSGNPEAIAAKQKGRSARATRACRRTTRCCSPRWATMPARPNGARNPSEARKAIADDAGRRRAIPERSRSMVPARRHAISLRSRSITDREALNVLRSGDRRRFGFRSGVHPRDRAGLSIRRRNGPALRRRISAARSARLRGRRNSTRGARVEYTDTSRSSSKRRSTRFRNASFRKRSWRSLGCPTPPKPVHIFSDAHCRARRTRIRRAT